jgi:hypothetical protein
MQSHAKGDVLTGVFYINANAPSFIDMLNVTDQPLATLAGIVDAAEPGSAGEVHGRAAVDFFDWRELSRRCWGRLSFWPANLRS